MVNEFSQKFNQIYEVNVMVIKTKESKNMFKIACVYLKSVSIVYFKAYY